MKDWVRKVYKLKIYTTTRFNWGYSEISSYVSMVKDIAIILTALTLIFKFHIPLLLSIVICVLFFVVCVVGGITLEKTGMLKYGASLTNHQSPELMEILQWTRQYGPTLLNNRMDTAEQHTERKG